MVTQGESSRPSESVSVIPTATWPETSPSLEEARRYCRNLARSHYENFVVATFLLPSALRQHLYNVYAYCRISDDLGDESGEPQVALERLKEWEAELNACYLGQVRHPVFIALRETIDRFEIPIQPFADLLKAFQLDQVKNRYETYAELLDYCLYSANPVGRLVLYLGGYRDPERQLLSDHTCTALQLANHWQDIHLDLVRLNRIYLPLEDMRNLDYSEADLRAQLCDARFARLMQLEIGRARDLFHKGLRLASLVEPRLALDVELFGRCGLELLERIEAVNYDVFRRRPTVSKWARTRLLVSCLRSLFVRRYSS
ncbi:MAG TPA: squalene synthase HpnC [Terriglobia bacterium]|nr:squalene synthase HpnC [Terriglobia bacterium]